MRPTFIALLAMAIAACPSPVRSQATTRPCDAVEAPGPACLLAHQELSSLPVGQVYWHLDRFKSKTAAQAAARRDSVVVASFGSTWLFTLGHKAWRAKRGEHVATVGPLPTPPAQRYAAEYLRSIFKPGASAPLHVHSGPEAFFAVSGDTCLETPSGVRTSRGSGQGLVIEAGPPMLLMAIGRVPRQGFALILHDVDMPPTTLTQAWHPAGLCVRQLAADQNEVHSGN